MITYSSTKQPQINKECITIGRLAPDFIALSTQGYVRLSDYRGKWVILASHPSAFGAVSTSEIIGASRAYDEVLNRNAAIIGLTTDNLNANLAWVYDIYKNLGVTIRYPIIADSNLEVTNLYGMSNPDRMFGETVRDVFFISPQGKISAIITLPVSTGRSGNEILRVLDSLIIKSEYNLDTPAGWEQGDPLVVPNPASYDEIISRMANMESLGYNCPLWYLCYTDLPNEGTKFP